jgi:hypothetical protein
VDNNIDNGKENNLWAEVTNTSSNHMSDVRGSANKGSDVTSKSVLTVSGGSGGVVKRKGAAPGGVMRDSNKVVVTGGKQEEKEEDGENPFMRFMLT